MAKRPTTTQIRARQVKLVRYQLTTKKTDAQVAKEFDLTTKQLRNIKSKSPKQLRRVWSRSTGLQKAYREVGPVSGKGSTRVKEVRLTPAPFRGKALRRLRRSSVPVDIRDVRIRQGIVIEEYYIIPGDVQATELHEARLSWAEWTEEHELPTSILAIQEMYDAGEIDDAAYSEAIAAWKEAYGIE